MNQPFSYKQLAEKIRDIFIHQDAFRLSKHIEEFKDTNQTYLGDFLYYSIMEPRDPEPPLMYVILSPYDMISKKSPQQALVYTDGKLLTNIEFTHYVDVRTGVMDSLLLTSLGADPTGKEVLYVGSGKVATESLRALKEFFPNLDHVSFYNKSGNTENFTKAAQELGVTATFVSLDDISTYDVIFCHTSSPTPVLTQTNLSQIKPGAVITTFVTVGSEQGEVAAEFYDGQHANIIMDWPQTLNMGKDLDKAITIGKVQKDQILLLGDMLSHKVKLDVQKKYTVYRSVGTPMQNLAVLKLINSNS